MKLKRIHSMSDILPPQILSKDQQHIKKFKKNQKDTMKTKIKGKTLPAKWLGVLAQKWWLMTLN